MSVSHSRSIIHRPKTAGERIADTVVGAMGSWRFIIIQTVIVVFWVALNIVEVVFSNRLIRTPSSS